MVLAVKVQPIALEAHQVLWAVEPEQRHLRQQRALARNRLTQNHVAVFGERMASAPFGSVEPVECPSLPGEHYVRRRGGNGLRLLSVFYQQD